MSGIADVRKRLADALSPVPVKVSVPDPRPRSLVVVRRTGGRRLNRLQDSIGIGVECWAATEQEAHDLAVSAASAIESLSFADGYEAARCESMRSDYDVAGASPRWYLSYTLTAH